MNEADQNAVIVSPNTSVESVKLITPSEMITGIRNDVHHHEFDFETVNVNNCELDPIPTEENSNDSFSDFIDSGSEYLPLESDDDNSESTAQTAFNNSILSPEFSPIVPTNASVSNVLPDDENLPSTSNRKRDKSETPKSQGRKRKRFPKFWKSSKAKVDRNAGREYTNTHGKRIAARKSGTRCSAVCKLKCSEKVSDETILLNFEKFWSLENQVRKWEFILRQSEPTEKKSMTLNAKSKRNSNRNYYLISSTKTPIHVCRKMFINTYGINAQWITTAVKKSVSGVVSPDKRGSNSRQKIVTKEIERGFIEEHINLFPLVESHYLRKNTTRLYIDMSGERENLSRARMFRLFIEWMETKNINHSVSERQYRDIFDNNFNIGFFIPKKDRCETCLGYENLSDEQQKEHFTNQQDHLKNKDIARAQKELDKNSAIESQGKVVTAVYDFQKVLISPQGDSSVFYYKRKYSTFNFTIFNMARHEGHCFTWHETIAKRGAIEVTSCLKIFIEGEVHKGAREFNFWSDNCGGQNRNKFVFAFYSWAAKKYNVKITHKFLEKGHTQNEGDAMHALIELRSKNRNIYVPSQWCEIIRFAKITKPFYNVVEMSQNYFLNIKEFAELLNFTLNIRGEKFVICKVKVISVSNTDPTKLNYKYNMTDMDFETIELIKPQKRRGRKQKCSIENYGVELNVAYNSMLPITEAKFKDLVEMCTRNAIPSTFHEFYKNLPHSASLDDYLDD